MKFSLLIVKKLDTLGIFLSGMCAVHCFIVPIMLSIGSVFTATVFASPIFEAVIFFTSFIVASISLLIGYFRCHHKLKAVAAMIFGFSIIGASRVVSTVSDEITLSVIGAVLIVFSHVINQKLCNTGAFKNEA